MESETTVTTKQAIYTHFSKQYFLGKQTQQARYGEGCMPPLLSFVDTCLTTTTFAWRSLTTGATCIIQPWTPRERSHSQCCCVAFPGARIVITTLSTSFSHAYACHVYITCMYVRVRTEIQSTDAILWPLPQYEYHVELFTVVVLYVLGQHMTPNWK